MAPFYVSKTNFRRSFYWSFISTLLTSCVLSKIPSRPKNENLEDFDSLVYDVAVDLSNLGPSLFGEFHPAGSSHDPLVKSGSRESFIKILMPKDTATNRTLESSPGFFPNRKYPLAKIMKGTSCPGTIPQYQKPPELRAPFLTFRKSFFCICTSLLGSPEPSRSFKKNGELCILRGSGYLVSG